jgi:hypothetical protein
MKNTQVSASAAPLASRIMAVNFLPIGAFVKNTC